MISLIQNENDEALARHVTHVHRENKHPALDFEPFSAPFLRAYIAKARQMNPYIEKDLTDYIVGYVIIQCWLTALTDLW
jgi:DNA replication licensing factor MCM7